MFESVALFGIVEFDYHAPAGATLHLYTDLPGNALAERETRPVPVSASRRTVKIRLLGTTKGKKYQVKVTSGGVVFLFGGRVYARTLGTAAQWAWYALPIAPTANEFTEYKLPIEATAEKFSEVKLPIPPTADQWTNVKLPMHPTPELFDFVDVPVAR